VFAKVMLNTALEQLSFALRTVPELLGEKVNTPTLLGIIPSLNLYSLFASIKR
jgi:hypothetical protein